jgi:biopolymer transport protein ExbD
MKFYRYPLAIIAYALIFIFIVAYGIHWLANKTPENFWYYFPAFGGAFLLISYILSLLKLHWELDVLFQVAVVLAPVLWFVNNTDPYKKPVYMFVTNPIYSGKLEVSFARDDKKTKTNINNPADTLYFKFNQDGEIYLNEDPQYIRYSIESNMQMVYPDGKKRKVQFCKIESLPLDTTMKVVVLDSQQVEKGRVKAMYYRIDYPQNLK